MPEQEMLVPTPGAEENASLGALSQMQQLRQQLQDEYTTARTGREQSRSALDEYYQQAINNLKKPVQDNTWLHMAIGALTPAWSSREGTLQGVRAAMGESERVRGQERANADLRAKLGIEWQGAKMKDYGSEADKLLAGMTRASISGAGGVGKWVQSKDDQGNLYWTNNVTMEQKVVPASRMPMWDKARSEGYRAAVAEEHPDPEAYAIAYANKVVGLSPGGVAPKTAEQPPVAQLRGTPPAKIPTVTEEPKGVGVIEQNLPHDVAEEVRRQTARLQANPNNAELRTSTLRRLREIAAQYPQAQGRISPEGEITPVIPPTGGPQLKYMDRPGRKGEEAYKSEEGKGLYKEFESLNAAASASARMQAQLELLKNIYANPNIPEGELAPTIQSLRSGLKSLGVPVDEAVGAADMANAVASNFALHLRTGEGTNLLPGAMSDYENRLLQKMSPALSQTNGGRLALIEYMREINKTNMRFADEARKLAAENKGVLPASWPQRRARVEKEEMARLAIANREIAKRFGGK